MEPDRSAPYRVALLDWLACAVGGMEEPAARAARDAGDGLLDRVAAAGTAGHVLDFDDTYLPGVAHLSAATAPVALVLGAEVGVTAGEALAAYAAGFEAMGAVGRAGHPALYDGGWHPTSVCGSLGAAVTAARLLGLDRSAERSAVAISLLRAAGLRSAFGGPGKSIQVGMAAAAGVGAARLAAAGAVLDFDAVARGPAGFVEAFGAGFDPAGGAGAVGAGLDAAGDVERFAAGFDAAGQVEGFGEGFDPGAAEAAIGANWIKAYPCCLQTHSAIEAALEAGEPGLAGAGGEMIEVRVHPLSLQAAAIPEPSDGLGAKFSVPYLVAFTLLHGPPGTGSFGAVEPEAARLARERVSVSADPALGESEAVILSGGDEVARVLAAKGSPERPLGEADLAAKRLDLAGERIEGLLDDDGRPASDLADVLESS